MGTENKIITKVGPLGRQGLSSGVKPKTQTSLLSPTSLHCPLPPHSFVVTHFFFFKLGFLCKTTHKVLDVFAAFSNNVCLSKLSSLTFTRYMEGAPLQAGV